MKVNAKKQQGAILVISLLILAVITMISLAGMRTATMEEKMASNIRDRSVAFQSAERGMLDAEAVILGFVNIAALNGTNGLLGETDAEPDYFDPNTWTGTNSAVSPNPIPLEADGTTVSRTVTPRFVVKHIGNVDPFVGANPVTTIGGYGQQTISSDVNLFKVITMSQGLSPNSIVFLQSYFARSGL